MEISKMKEIVTKLRNILYSPYPGAQAEALSLVNELWDTLSDYSNAGTDGNDVYHYDPLTGYEFVDHLGKHRLNECILDIPKFTRELASASRSTLTNCMIPSEADDILKNMEYTPAVVYLVVSTVIADMQIFGVSTELDLAIVDYPEFRNTLAKILICTLGINADAVAENLYTVEEQIDAYESMLADIDDIALTSVKILN